VWSSGRRNPGEGNHPAGLAGSVVAVVFAREEQVAYR
jgi:hypothetical protein